MASSDAQAGLVRPTVTAAVARRVYVLQGFDPRGVVPLHALLRQSYRLPRRPPQRPGDGFSRWPLEPTGSEELVCLHWHDIARRHWPGNPLRLVVDGLPIVRWYLLEGGLMRTGRLSCGAALIGLYPLLVLVALVAVAALAALLAALWGGAVAALAAAALVLVAGWRLAERLGVVWLSRSLRFTHRLASGEVPELQPRLDAWAGQMVELERQCPAAELLLVGHSSGSFLALLLAAELRRRPEAAGLAARLTLLTLGSNIPHLTLLPAAAAFRADLSQMLEPPRLPWMDWSSSDDWLCFAGVNPFAVLDPATADADYPSRRQLPLAEQRGLRGFWGRFGHQFDLHFDYWHWLPLEARRR